MISVIVPIYKTEKYLDTCIKSLINQSYNNFELLLIIDGRIGNEKCVEICDYYSRTDKRVRLIVKEKNEGVDKTRFYGLEKAEGDYITFVDSDDWLEKDALLVLRQRMQESNYDYVEIGYSRRLGPFRQKRKGLLSGEIRAPELFEQYFISFFGVNILSVTLWGKLYRKDVIKRANLEPSRFKMGEDLMFNLHLFPYLKSIFIESYYGYNYRYGGMTNKYNQYLLHDSKKQFLEKIKLIDQYNYYKASDSVRIEMINILLSDIIQKIEKSNIREDVIIEQIREEINSPFWDRVLSFSNKEYYNRHSIDALRMKSPERLFAICKGIVKKNIMRRIMVKVAANLF